MQQKSFGRRLYQFSFRSEDMESSEDSGGAGECGNQLSLLTKDAAPASSKGNKNGGLLSNLKSKILGDSQHLSSEESGRKDDGEYCSLCKVIFEKAKCLATSTDQCGMAVRHKLVDVQCDIEQQIRQDITPNIDPEDKTKSDRCPPRKAGETSPCKTNSNYITDVETSTAVGATPEEIRLWIDEGQNFARADRMATFWMGWSALMFAKPEVLCSEAESPLACENFVKSQLRKDMCIEEDDVTNACVFIYLFVCLFVCLFVHCSLFTVLVL